ncbi:MAG: hypothetical protein EOM54_00540 [Clostridia bacterium]|nr:hypothetical protein [Clostridia bacterium]
MNTGKTILALLSVALLLAANLRVVYHVSVAGEEVPGSFSADMLESCENAARAAAEEITMTGGETSGCEGYDKSALITLSAPDGDGPALTRSLLENAGGVETAWAVSVGGTGLGNVNDPSALGEVMESILADGAVHGAVAAEFTEKIDLRRVFVPEGSEYDLMAMARAIRGATEVMSVTSDGTIRYG